LESSAHQQPRYSAEQTGQHQLDKYESDQAIAKQDKTGHGHHEETVRSKFFAHGAPPFASPLKQNDRPGLARLVRKRAGTRANVAARNPVLTPALGREISVDRMGQKDACAKQKQDHCDRFNHF
jgi:hypothetical protein